MANRMSRECYIQELRDSIRAARHAIKGSRYLIHLEGMAEVREQAKGTLKTLRQKLEWVLSREDLAVIEFRDEKKAEGD